jgi:hypothetical protein
MAAITHGPRWNELLEAIALLIEVLEADQGPRAELITKIIRSYRSQYAELGSGMSIREIHIDPWGQWLRMSDGFEDVKACRRHPSSENENRPAKRPAFLFGYEPNVMRARRSQNAYVTREAP